MHVVYPGSFDPPTSGHLHVVERAQGVFEKITVLVAMNPDKKPWFSVEQRMELWKELTQSWPNVDVQSGEGLLVDKVKALNADAILKGVRGPSDLEVEHHMANVNSRLGEGVETVILLSHEGYAHTSSSLVKQVFKLGGDVSPFVPPIVQAALKELQQ